MKPPIGSPPDLEWTQDGRPKATRFEDSYFAPDPIEESRLVFVAGCGLTESWRKPGGVRVIGETGFGTGLNFLLAWAAWREAPHAPRTLDFVSVEAFPLNRDQMTKAHARFAGLEGLSATLLAQWPDSFSPGLHQLVFEEGRVRLTLLVGEAAELADLVVPGGVEAWFLDGFAPSRNPDMWRTELFEALAFQSAPGARLASFTAAGAVRRGLAEAGFAVERLTGFGTKRHRIIGAYDGAAPRAWWQVPRLPNGAVAIEGAGIAGLCAAHALRQAGIEVSISDPAGPGSGASGNVAALVMPRVFVGKGAEAELLSLYFDRAHRLWTSLGVLQADGVDQVAQSDKDADRFARFAALTDAEWDGERRLLHHPRGGIVRPRAVLEVVGAGVPMQAAGAPAVRIEAKGAAVPLDDPDWPVHFRAGQTIHVRAAGLPPRPLIEVEFAAPLGEGEAMVGASFTPWQDAAAPDPDGAVEADLLAAAARLGLRDVAVLSQWSGVRVMLPDRLPALGPVHHEGSPDPALWRMTGLGARGFVTAPLLGEMLADCVAGRVLPVLAPVWRYIHVGRFAERAGRRNSRRSVT